MENNTGTHDRRLRLSDRGDLRGPNATTRSATTQLTASRRCRAAVRAYVADRATRRHHRSSPRAHHDREAAVFSGLAGSEFAVDSLGRYWPNGHVRDHVEDALPRFSSPILRSFAARTPGAWRLVMHSETEPAHGILASSRSAPLWDPETANPSMGPGPARLREGQVWHAIS